MTISENEIKFQVVMLVVEAVAFLGLAAWCLSRLREGRWALVGAVGAALAGLGLGLFAATSVEGWFFETGHLGEFFFIDHAHLDTAVYVGRAAGALLLLTAFVLSRRTTAESPPGSIYGP